MKRPTDRTIDIVLGTLAFLAVVCCFACGACQSRGAELPSTAAGKAATEGGKPGVSRLAIGNATDSTLTLIVTGPRYRRVVHGLPAGYAVRLRNVPCELHEVRVAAIDDRGRVQTYGPAWVSASHESGDTCIALEGP